MKHIRMCFERHVLSEALLRQALDAAVAGYATKVRETDRACSFDLQADLADDALDLGGLPPMQGEARLSAASSPRSTTPSGRRGPTSS